MTDNSTSAALELRDCLVALARYEEAATGDVAVARKAADNISMLFRQDAPLAPPDPSTRVVVPPTSPARVYSKAFRYWAITSAILFGLWFANLVTGTNGDAGVWPLAVSLPWGMALAAMHLTKRVPILGRTE